MPSGKQSKRRRAAEDAASPQPRRASPRVLIAAAAALVLIVVGVVLGVVLTRDSSSGASGDKALPGAGAVQVLFDGIPQEGQVLGSPSAPVTMVEYVDLQCPYCMDFETQAMPKLIADYVRKDKLKIDLRTIAALGPDSQRGRSAVLAAAEQNRMFNLVQLLYENQGKENSGWLSDELVKAAAASIPGLDVDQLVADRTSNAVGARALQIENQARADAVQVTPSIYVGKTGGTLTLVTLLSSIDSNSVARAVDKALG